MGKLRAEVHQLASRASPVAQLRKRLGMHPVQSTWVLVLECGHIAALNRAAQTRSALSAFIADGEPSPPPPPHLDLLGLMPVGGSPRLKA
jgi:hypothetical protein